MAGQDATAATDAVQTWIERVSGRRGPQQLRARAFRDGHLVSELTERVGGPVFLVRGGTVRAVNLAWEDLDEVFDQMMSPET